MSQGMKMNMLALRGLVVLPGTKSCFDVSREKSKAAIQKSLMEDGKLFLVSQIDPNEKEFHRDGIYEIGTIVNICEVDQVSKEVLRVVIEGEKVAKLQTVVQESPFLIGNVVFVEEIDDIENENEREGYRRQLLEVIEEYIHFDSGLEKSVYYQLEKIEDLSKILWEALNQLNIHFSIKQKLLELVVLSKRVIKFCNIMLAQVDVIKTKLLLQLKLKKKVDEHQKEYIYREQISMLHKELGDTSDTEELSQEYNKRLESLDASDEVKAKIKKEINRFRSISSSSEEGVLETYIETMLELPWNKVTIENTDMNLAKKRLEEDHYGLTKIKERIIEYLAERFYSQISEAPILCLVGPPGTGKTSIAKSIARALDLTYERICLGGVKDEAEIRGHRKTYIGAMPGRIATAMQHAGASNPLLLLDEIDKMGSDHRGDISAAMLEVLDSEQNAHFRDHYLEVPMDLSRVLFVATANSTDTIPRPLLDRMEMIEVSSYTRFEKYHIGQKYLLKKQLKKHGLPKTGIRINKNEIFMIIDNYTREAGVRKLERLMGTIVRKIILLEMEEGHSQKEFQSRKLTKEDIITYLGEPKYTEKKGINKGEIGIVHGLAWTAVGGDTLDVEAITLPGENHLQVTGNLGDVMKESATIAYTYVKSIVKQDKENEDFFNEHDVAIHVPEGATPKDGPSAGITMVTAIYSAITKRPVKGNLAMTGEITLTGKILPIGGLREKMVAAKGAGITELIVPLQNKKDIKEMEEEIKKGFQIHYGETYEDVLKVAFLS